MEDNTQINETIGSSGSPEKDESSNSSSHIVSLPLLISRKFVAMQKEHFHAGDHTQKNHEPHSSTKFEYVNLEAVPKERIYENVYNFLKKMLDNPSMLQNLLQCFEQLQKQFKKQLKKSKKSIFKVKLTVNNLSEAQLKDKSKENQMKKNGLLKLPKLLRNKDSMQNVSLKLINSKDNIINKQNLNSFKEMTNIAQAYNIKDEVLLEGASGDNKQQSIPPPKQQKIVRFNLIEPPQINQKIDQENLSENGESQKTNQNIFLYKQSSIMIIEEENDNESELFSSEGVLSITDMELPTIPFTEDVLSRIYDSPAPFFINFALCIFLKCLLKSKITLTPQNVVYLLGISTLVSYKAYFDETIDGLIDHFAQILLVSAQKILDLERWFLDTINYEVGVSSKQYQQVMFRLISQTK